MSPRVFKSLVIQVWHPESPGTRVYVRRGWWKRLWYNPEFAHPGERHLTFLEMLDMEEQATQLAKILHALFERHAIVHDHPFFIKKENFNIDSPSGRLLHTVCLSYLTGGYRLNVMNEDHGLSAKELVDSLRLMPIKVTRSLASCEISEDNPLVAEIQMHAVDERDQASMSLSLSDGQIAYIRVEDANIVLLPAEKSRILYELSDYVNAQLFVQKSELRVISAEFWWTEPTVPHIEHRSKQTIKISVWENLITNPDYQSHVEVARPLTESDKEQQ